MSEIVGVEIEIHITQMYQLTCFYGFVEVVVVEEDGSLCSKRGNRGLMTVATDRG